LMRYVLSIALILIFCGPALSGPPEPIVPPEPPEIPEQTLKTLESLKIELEMNKDLLDKRLKGVLEKLDQGLEISEISIAADSIVITFSNDSVFILADLDKGTIPTSGKDVLRVGGNMVVEEDQVIHGDIVSAFGDVTVKGTVDGSVLTLSGNIYVPSTGYIKESAFAVSGKVKREPGARIGSVVWDSPYSASGPDFGEENQPFRIMGYVLLLIYLFWMILAATCASIFKKNISTVMAAIKANSFTSFLKGYLAYVLVFLAFVVLSITILGIPLAFLGIPIATLAGMILGFTAVSVILGQKILRVDELSFKTFIYGSLAMGAVPGLFFLTLTLTGSVVVMIFSWIFVFLFLSVILPVGLGAILTTRFGVRPAGQKQPE